MADRQQTKQTCCADGHSFKERRGLLWKRLDLSTLRQEGEVRRMTSTESQSQPACLSQPCDKPPAFGAYCIDHVPDGTESETLSVMDAAFALRDARGRLDKAAADGLDMRDHYGFCQLNEQCGLAGRAFDRAVDAYREATRG